MESAYYGQSIGQGWQPEAPPPEAGFTPQPGYSQQPPVPPDDAQLYVPPTADSLQSQPAATRFDPPPPNYDNVNNQPMAYELPILSPVHAPPQVSLSRFEFKNFHFEILID